MTLKEIPKTGTCKECPAYDPVWDDEGLCKLNPPNHLDKDDDFIWPEVDCNEWCYPGRLLIAEQKVMEKVNG